MRNAIVALAAMGLLAGCGGSSAGYTASAGSVALSRDGKRVYAVDTDNDALEVVDANTFAKLNEVKVGHLPARVAVGADERIYVTNRGERTVSVLSPDTFKEVARIPVGVEPVGLTFDASGKNLYVVSATGLDDASHGTLTDIDTATLEPSWTVTVGQEPRGVAVVGDKAYVTQLKKDSITVVDLKAHQVSSGISLASNDDPNPQTNPNAMTAGGVVDVTAAPDGKRVYAPHLWELVGNIQANRSLNGVASGGGSYGGGVDPCGTGASSIVAAGMATIVTSTDTAKSDSLSTCPSASGGDVIDANGNSVPAPATDFPPSLMPSANTDGHIVQNPAAAVVDPTGMWLFVVNQSSDNVVVMPTHSRKIDDANGVSRLVIPVGAGSNGIALSADGRTAFVYSQFDHRLSVIQQKGGPTGLGVVANVTLAADTLPADQAIGRRMFYSATDPNMTSPSVGIACISCHLSNGREDGHVWEFPDGPRQTPSLAGRDLGLTAPYHWAGLFPTVGEFFRETISGRMGGKGLTPAQASKVTAFIEGIPEAPNPFQGRPDLLAAQQRGQKAFVKAGCEKCHTGTAYTDNGLHDVGTLTSADRLEVLQNGVEANVPFPQLQAVNTPSLLGLARTAPYLHDGSVATLRGRILQARDPKFDGTDHGDTSMLSDQEIDDLQQYLRSL